MEFGILLGTVIVLSLMLAAIAGFAAARVLMHAAETGSPGHGGRGEGPNDR